MTRTEVNAQARVVLRMLARGMLPLVVVTVLYLVLPEVAVRRSIVVAVAFVLGLAGAIVLIIRQVIAYRSAAASGSARLMGLLVAIYLAVLFFALTYNQLAVADPGEIDGLQTRVDALYFSLTIVSTVGFGDIHAAGQAARAVVSLQMAFNLLVISLAVAAVRDAGRPAVAPRPRDDR
jgi:voltage-gated potassium channel